MELVLLCIIMLTANSAFRLGQCSACDICLPVLETLFIYLLYSLSSNYKI
jgi:hypothetical protein